jgi:hypothetical protein
VSRREFFIDKNIGAKALVSGRYKIVFLLYFEITECDFNHNGLLLFP